MVLDTSAIIAILRNEPERTLFSDLIIDAPIVRISTATLIEAGVVTLRKLGEEAVPDLDRFVRDMKLTIEPQSLREVGPARGA